MTLLEFQSRSIETLARKYVDSRKNHLVPVSTSAAIRAIRAVLGNGARADKEIVDAVASHAYSRGLAVEFDAMAHLPREYADMGRAAG